MLKKVELPNCASLMLRAVSKVVAISQLKSRSFCQTASNVCLKTKGRFKC